MTSRIEQVTIRDVARVAGVSITTVSDAINGKGRVDPETRARVVQTAAALGWRPRRSARALRSGRYGAIALCIPQGPGRFGPWLASTDYYMALATGCAVEAVALQRLLLLAPRPRDLDELARLDVDGVILVDPVESDPLLKTLDSTGVPAVTVDRALDHRGPWWVSADNRGSVTLLLEHLTERGARRIALVSCAERWAWFEDAASAYGEWCRERGVEPIIWHVDVDDPGASASAVVGSHLDAGQRPDGIVAVPYHAALGVIRAARERGLTVPGDLLVASGVDGHALETSTPPVTAVDIRPADLGHAAVRLLASRIEGRDGEGPVVLPALLRARESTGER